MRKLIIPILALTLVTACKKNPEKPVPNVIDSMAQAKEKNIEEAAQKKKTDEVAVKAANDQILQALKSKDYKTFGSFIHPEKGVTFSMYGFVDPKEDRHFSKEDFEKYQPTKTVFSWGAQDGSGDPYKATINDYLSKWLFSKDFTTSHYSLNTFQGKGNSLNNLKEVYPGKDFTENFIKGTEENGKMDWKTLRFVFEEFQGKQYLVAVVNDQWTI
ncbi:hypothetical protein N0B40_01565 [Chryseobacterium oranimense]|uniref:hypothetical protein n=1 Tax=Chryseobacterium oranimense TaxID=421058 RepID=UPI0021AF9D5E|nr:hypothetical protein [Chryseobacterium oranimense]UWX60966.1 hypothetical protein N0B40_01565 [Chryseobacterium oranimense]